MDQVNPEAEVQPTETEVTETQQTETKEVAPPDGPTQPEAKPEEPGEQPKGVAKRLRELTDRAKAAEQREARLMALLEKGGTQPQAPTGEPETPKTLKDFDWDEGKYREYLYAEARKEAEKAARDAGARWREEQEAITRRAKFDAKAAEFAKTHEDYYDVTDVGDPEHPSWACSQAMADVINESDDGPALVYYLAQNPDEALKLFRMAPGAAGRAMAKLEDRLAAERKKAAEKPVSKAPPPPAKLEATGDAGLRVSASSPDSDKLSTKEWVKAWQREHRRKE